MKIGIGGVRSVLLSAYKIALALFVSIVFISKVEASGSDDDIMDTIIDTLSQLTCETQGVGDLLKSEFAHTCNPEAFSTFFIANILSPGLYANTLLRVKMNDDILLPEQCLRRNRADPDDPRISFAMCNNIQLAALRAEAINNSAVAIASAIFTGDAPWDEIAESWDLDPRDYHEVYNDLEVGDEGQMFDIGVIPVFPWKIIQSNDQICVATISFAGWIPIGCKFIKEPFPISIYADFISNENLTSDLEDNLALTTCSTLGTCYGRVMDNSKAGMVMTSPVVECVREMVAKLAVSNAVCSFDDLNLVAGTILREDSALFQFQKNMHRIVTLLLTIYVILFGFRMVLTGDIPHKTELTGFVLKFLFVVYFAVGINVSGGTDRLDGMVQLVVPFLIDGMAQAASWILAAGASDLCVFDSSEYIDGMQHLALWDSLDCRLAHYTGIDMYQTFIVDNASRNHDFANFDFMSFPIPPYMYLILPALITLNFTLIGIAVTYPLMIISVGAFVVYTIIVCMICIAILAIMAPLFVPMFLFNFTRGYFETYARMMLSFMLQPMVAIVFMTTMLTVYDYGFYGTCKYDHAYLNDGGRQMKYFFVDNDWSHYTDEEKEGCVNSMGFMLNNPLTFIAEYADDFLLTRFPALDVAFNSEDFNAGGAAVAILDTIFLSPRLFFSLYELYFDIIKKLAIAMLTAFLMLYLMFEFSENLTNFAADMTEGVSISDMVAISSKTVYTYTKKAIEVADMAVQAAAAVVTGGASAAASAKVEAAKQAAKKATDQATKQAVGKVRSKVVSELKDKAVDKIKSEVKSKVKSEVKSKVDSAKDKASSVTKGQVRESRKGSSSDDG